MREFPTKSLTLVLPRSESKNSGRSQRLRAVEPLHDRTYSIRFSRTALIAREVSGVTWRPAIDLIRRIAGGEDGAKAAEERPTMQSALHRWPPVAPRAGRRLHRRRPSPRHREAASALWHQLLRRSSRGQWPLRARRIDRGSPRRWTSLERPYRNGRCGSRRCRAGRCATPTDDRATGLERWRSETFCVIDIPLGISHRHPV